MKRLTALATAGLLDPLDAELGALLMRRSAAALDGTDDALHVGMAGAMLSAERARGQSCLALDAMVSAMDSWRDTTDALPADAGAWRALLDRSGICGDGETLSPLVLDTGRLYLYRYHAAERRLAESIRTRLARGSQTAPTAATVALFQRLFPADASGGADWQAVAAAASRDGRLTIITGGPGTGKTTTVARILALLLHESPSRRVALAAPTGKAAARLAESISASVATLPLDDALRARIPSNGTTLHRLLGYRPWDDEFAHDADEPLVEDVVIVDEASMVDVLMMDALFAALRPSAQLILLGDQHQLASVDTGHVLGDICRAAEASGELHGATLASEYAALSGVRIQTATNVPPLRDAVVRLRRSYRFAEHHGIGALAEAIRAGDSAGALAVLQDGTHSDVQLHGAPERADELLATVSELIDHYLSAQTPAEALERFGAMRILCAVREGRTGVVGLNERIERALRARGAPMRAPWYHLRPVLITANDAAIGLYNGDVGVTMREGASTRVWFATGSGAPRSVAPARLPAFETAWAMTVHKSQGSEFGRVLVVLPETDVAVLTRELLYTAVTRARRRVDLFGDGELFSRAVARTTRRASGLAERLAR